MFTSRRISLSPFEIYLRHKEMVAWLNSASETYRFLSQEKRERIKNLVKSLYRKTSAGGALKMMDQISEVLGMRKSATEFCSQKTLSGLLGVNHVISVTLGFLFDNSILSRTYFSFTNSIVSIDTNASSKAQELVKRHEHIQSQLWKLHPQGQESLRICVNKIFEFHKQKTYPLSDLLSIGQEIEKIFRNGRIYDVSDPIYAGLWECNGGLACEIYEDKNLRYKNPEELPADFYLIAKNYQKNDPFYQCCEGFQQYLYVVLFSLKVN